MSTAQQPPAADSPARPQVLDPLNFPLYGSRLIEASAGTGKTYTIATLYVRLVLGHGDGAAHGRALMPPEILVVTFTEAATQELRERIRERLMQAAASFECAPAQQRSDALLDALRQSYEPSRWPSCARQLRLAAEWMDEAAVATIHSWCYRMLREHAFDSGSLLQQNLITDQQDLQAQVVRDYWRCNFYPLPPEQVALVQQYFKSPDDLGSALRPLLPRVDARYTVGAHEVQPPDSLSALLGQAQAAQQQQQALEQQARQIWRDEREALRKLFADLRAHLNGTTYRQVRDEESFAGWQQGLDLWADSGQQSEALKLDNLGLSRIKLKAGKAKPDHRFFQVLDDWVAIKEQAPRIKPALLLHALVEVRQDLEQTKQRRAELGFDDLLARLGQALNGSRGQALAQAIRQRFPVALIDEFQDTDPLQYRIFERIYGACAQAPTQRPLPAAAAGMATGCGWFMIGDPKQAIYAFRGADIHTYLQARAATEGRHYTLGTNYRSSRAMVAAVNYVFNAAEQRANGAGAFRFRTAQGDNPLPFVPVQAHGRAEQLRIDQQPVAALTAWYLSAPNGADDDVLQFGDYRAEMAERSASAVRLWLAQAAEGRTGFQAADGSLRPLRPADIAILVRGRSEAEAVRRALARRQIASVYLSDRDSVFASAEAGDMLAWLQACAQPADDGLLRCALASAAMDWSWAELDRLNHDELHWEALVHRLQGYRRIWQQQGVLPMMRHWLSDFEVASRLLAQPQGERRLTNLLHLAEWLQRQALELDGEHALIRAFQEQIEQPREEEILRLESDAGLIQVITIHKSKGLEYPLVLLPFIARWKEVEARGGGLAYHAQATPESGLAGGYTIELDAKSELAKKQADEERLSEDLRLLYVALTRAQHGVWLGVGPLVRGAASKTKGCSLSKSALGYLLDCGAEVKATELRKLLQDWAADCDALSLVPAPERDDCCLPLPAATALGPVRQVGRAPAERWWIASYSALRLAGGVSEAGFAGQAELAQPAVLEAVSAQQAQLQEAWLQQQRESATALAAGADPSGADAAAMDWLPPAHRAAPLPDIAWHGLPQGAEMGSLIHSLLEQAAQQGFAEVAAAPQSWQAQIARQCAWRGWSAHSAALQEGLLQLLTRAWPLPGQAPLVLAGLHSYSSEMEFWLSARRVETRTIDQLVCRHTLGGQARPLLLPERLNGMLKGFMDLVFEHQGRYYIADYKTNWLGSQLQDYDGAALRLSMLKQRYDLQYSLYLLALHRLLASRLPDYDYERDVGGVVYFYLRGMVGTAVAEPAQAGLFFERPPQALIEALDALFAGSPADPSEFA
jgi:exodeoxyribonuclease V beta subunit